MFPNMTSSSILSHHLSTLLTRLHDGDLSGAQQKRLGEFLMREEMICHFQAADKDENDEAKWLKYFTLGWFIYEVMGVEGS